MTAWLRLASVLVLGMCLGYPVSSPRADVRPYIISQDYGGILLMYVTLFHQIKLSGREIYIDGECHSACTLVLSLEEQVCITPKAVFYFHEASVNGLRAIVATNYLYNQYPAPVRSMIDERGGLQADWIRLDYNQLKKVVRNCEAIGTSEVDHR